MKSVLVLFLLAFASFSSPSWAAAPLCQQIFADSKSDIIQISEEIPAGWMLPNRDTEAYKKYSAELPMPLRRELENVGHWDQTQTALPRIPVPVARLTDTEIQEIAVPRLHEALPSINAQGVLYYPDHVPTDDEGRAQNSETFHVRMMVIKNKGSMEMILPASVEYLRPFFEKSWELEKARDPEGFRNRYAFIQVDASWVEAHQNQPRPGKTTEQSPDPKKRLGAHVDGFLQEKFWPEMQEDITYATSFGYDPLSKSHYGDSIPTEFFTVGFPIPEGLTHPQARVVYDQIANMNTDKIVTFPSGVISRMSSRAVHRVGVAHRKTYRTFVKIKFTDEAFNQSENTINVDTNGKPVAIYSQWKKQGLPFVDRKTLPTEGVIAPQDAHFFQERKSISGP